MKNIISIYKIPLLISLTLAVILTALPVLKEPITIGIVFFSSIVGTFILDLDYIIHAYFIEPEKDFSKTLRAYIKHKDTINAVKHVSLHKSDVEDKTLNSALFQVVFALFSIFVMFSDIYYPLKALVLSILANSIYRLSELYFTKQAKNWFWAFKSTPDNKGVVVYMVIITSIFIYCLTII